MLQLTYELRPKWQNNKTKTKSQNAVSRSDPVQGSDNDSVNNEPVAKIFGFTKTAGALIGFSDSVESGVKQSV